MFNAFATCPDFACDDFADFLAAEPPAVADVPAGLLPAWHATNRFRGLMLADTGFLLAVHTAAQSAGPGVALPRKVACEYAVADLVAWRMGPSVAQQHATARPATVAADQTAAARNRRHRMYCDGMLTRALPAA